MVTLAPACRAMIDSIASTKSIMSKPPAVEKPSAEPTRTGAALAARNCGREACRIVNKPTYTERKVIPLILATRGSKKKYERMTLGVLLVFLIGPREDAG